MGVRPGRPPADPHLVLDAIIWKMAHHARWQDLPLGYPSMAVCRRYYRRIFRSGRLCTIYRHLYKDLCARSRLDLTALVERGCFTIQGSTVLLRPGLPETWRLRTALLFMQLGFQILRRLRREKNQQLRRKFPLRMSSRRSLHAPPQRQAGPERDAFVPQKQMPFFFPLSRSIPLGQIRSIWGGPTVGPGVGRPQGRNLPSPGEITPPPSVVGMGEVGRGSGEAPGVGRPQGRNLPSPFCALQNGEGPGVGPPSSVVNRLPSSSGGGALSPSAPSPAHMDEQIECVRILNVNGPALVLASNSPRRRQLLGLLGWSFQSRPADVDERQRPGEAPAHYVQRLALDKVQTVAASAQPDELILAADTAVVDGQAVLGKPGDASDAAGMLRQLRGHTHQVLTGLALLRASDGKLVADLCVTDVPMRAYRDDEIEAYVVTGDPLDKAGAYAIQHAGFHPVEGLRGCQASVMGLPLCHLARSLRKLGLEPASGISAACQSALNYACPISSAVLRGEKIG